MQSSKDFLLKVYKKVEEKGIIDEELIIYLDSIFSNNAENILEVLSRGFKKYKYISSNRTIWAVMGKAREIEYLIYPRIYCSCLNFYKQVLQFNKKKLVYCKHILAQILSDILKNYQEIELDDNNFSKRIKELKLKL